MDKSLRILIVEDSEDDALLLLLELRRGGYKTVHQRVETPEAMREALVRSEWDLVISDYVMPRFTGLDALRVVKEAGLDLPFIIVSGNIGEDIAVEAMRAGAQDYIVKGKLTRLVAAVERELRDAETRGKHRLAEAASALNSAILQLFAQKMTKKEYLDAVTNLIRDWSGCRYAGIRTLGEDGQIPYAAWVNFNQAFLESENALSLAVDQCACTRIIAEKPEPRDGAAMTPYGSFYTNDFRAFMEELPEEERARFRGVCVQSGFFSVCVVPIRYRERILGAIHLADERKDRAPLKNIELLEQMGLIIGEAIYRFSVEEDLIRQREELVRMNEQLRNLSAHINAVREGERTNIAREIHDELGQVLTAIKIDVSWFRRHLPPRQRKLADKAGETLQIIDSAIQSVKRISSDLRPGILDDIGLAPAVQWAARDFEKRTGIPCAVSVTPETVSVDRTRSTAVFRILQESLTNIVRHANASKVDVLLEEKDRAIVLTVTDNGKGIKKEELSDSHSFGLIGMRERVQFLGGEVEITGVRAKGTTVRVALPIDSRKETGEQSQGSSASSKETGKLL